MWGGFVFFFIFNNITIFVNFYFHEKYTTKRQFWKKSYTKFPILFQQTFNSFIIIWSVSNKMLEILIIFCSIFSINIYIDYSNIEIYLMLIRFSGKLFFLPNFCRIWSFSNLVFSFVSLIFILLIISGGKRSVGLNLYQPTILYKSILFNALFITYCQYLRLVLWIIRSSFLYLIEIVLNWLDELVYLKYVSAYSAIY